MHSTSCGTRCTYSAAHSSKIFKSLSITVLLCQGYCWIGKYTNEAFNRAITLIIRPRNKHFAIPFFLFWSISLSNLFLITFLKLLAIHFGMVANTISISVMWTDDFWFYITDEGHQLYSKMSRKIFKRKCNLNFTRVIRNSSFDLHFVYMWSTSF